MLLRPNGFESAQPPGTKNLDGVPENNKREPRRNRIRDAGDAWRATRGEPRHDAVADGLGQNHANLDGDERGHRSNRSPKRHGR